MPIRPGSPVEGSSGTRSPPHVPVDSTGQRHDRCGEHLSRSTQVAVATDRHALKAEVHMTQRTGRFGGQYPRARIARFVAAGYLVIVAAVMVWVALAMFVLAKPGDPVFDGALIYLVTLPTSIALFAMPDSLNYALDNAPVPVAYLATILHVFVLPGLIAVFQAWVLWLMVRGARSTGQLERPAAPAEQLAALRAITR